MNFLQKLGNVLSEYEHDECMIQGDTTLWGVQSLKPLFVAHITFSPLSKMEIQYLQDSYKRSFPEELLDVYRYTNGAFLFRSVRAVGKTGMKIPYSQFSIYGVPRCNDRKHLEPLNISLEDLDRPDDAPMSWLKFGSFETKVNADNCLDLYIDTEAGFVYALQNRASRGEIKQQWATLDDCLCYIMDMLMDP